MSRIIDARGLACPQPVVLTKKALTQSKQVTTIVDNPTAVENVTRLARSNGYSVEVTSKPDGTYLTLYQGDASPPPAETARDASCAISAPASGPTVLFVASDSLGQGAAELGERLMGAFFHTLLEVAPKPQTIIFINSGVKLAVLDSRALEDLQALAAQGVEIAACGTCLGYYELTDKLAVGHITNMYDIATALLGAGRVVKL
jgi:selenium metabolism protein YedF